MTDPPKYCEMYQAPGSPDNLRIDLRAMGLRAPGVGGPLFASGFMLGMTALIFFHATPLPDDRFILLMSYGFGLFVMVLVPYFCLRAVRHMKLSGVIEIDQGRLSIEEIQLFRGGQRYEWARGEVAFAKIHDFRTGHEEHRQTPWLAVALWVMTHTDEEIMLFAGRPRQELEWVVGVLQDAGVVQPNQD